jgi:hypothetical protein
MPRALPAGVNATGTDLRFQAPKVDSGNGTRVGLQSAWPGLDGGDRGWPGVALDSPANSEKNVLYAGALRGTPAPLRNRRSGVRISPGALEKARSGVVFASLTRPAWVALLPTCYQTLRRAMYGYGAARLPETAGIEGGERPSSAGRSCSRAESGPSVHARLERRARRTPVRWMGWGARAKRPRFTRAKTEALTSRPCSVASPRARRSCQSRLGAAR